MSTRQKADFVLNEKERKLVEEHHNLIYSFLFKYNYPEEEFYDVAAIALCYAAHSYQEDKGAFSTYAYHTMYLRVSRAYQLQHSATHIPDALLSSLDEPLDNTENDDFTLLSIIESPYNLEEDIIEKSTYEKFYSQQTIKTQKFLSLFQQGYNGREIAEVFQCTPAWPENVRRELRNIYKARYCKN